MFFKIAVCTSSLLGRKELFYKKILLDISKIFSNNYFTEHLAMAASLHYCFLKEIKLEEAALNYKQVIKPF